MVLISYISIPVQTAEGITYMKVDLQKNQIQTDKNQVLVELREIIEDIHHFEDAEMEDVIDTKDIKEKLIEELASKLIVCTSKEEAEEYKQILSELK